MNSPKVSIIIPFFNSKRYLKETIESVFSQTFKNWELCLVDDGSTDSSADLVVSYVNQYPDKVHYLYHEGHQNRGASPSRNLGFKNSRGDIILFLDSDDILLPLKLEAHLPTFELHPEVDALFGGTLFWYSWTHSLEDQTKDFIWEPWIAQGIQPDTIIQPPSLLKLLIKSNVMPCPSGLLLRREVLDLIGGWPEDINNIYDDHGFCVKLFMKATVFIASGWQEKYRIHEDSWIHSTEKEGKTLPARIFYLNWVKEYLLDQNYHDAQIDQYLMKALIPYQNPSDPSQIEIPLPVGLKYFGDLHRVTPVSRKRGFDRSRSVRGVRGQPVDRYYIEAFLQHHISDIKGRVLEVGNSGYTRLFGGDRIIKADSIDVNHFRKNRNHYFGLANGGDDFPPGVFDCLILSQTLSFIYDVELAIKNAYSALIPGGILLATLPGISQIYHPEMEQSGDYWRFTAASVQRLFGEVFGNENITVVTFGNVLSASAYLFGLESQELKKDELDFNDPDYQVTVAVRAVKREQKIPAANVIGKFVSTFGKAKRYFKRHLNIP